MNTDPIPCHAGQVINWLGSIAIVAILVGGFLIFRGYEGGSVYSNLVSAIIGALSTYLVPKIFPSSSVNDPTKVETVITETKTP